MIGPAQVERLMALAQELDDSCSSLRLKLEPHEALVVLVAMQACWRARGLDRLAAAVLEDIGRQIQETLAGYDPELGRLVEAGWRREE